MKETRTEEDFLDFIKATVGKIPKEDEVILLHMSVSLVEWVAEQIGFKGELGKKGYKGILKSMKTRSEFLEKENHRN